MSEAISPVHAKVRPSWRKWAFRGTLATSLFTVLLLGAFWGREYWQRRPLLEGQRQCLTYARPVTDVVYESDPAAARALVALRPNEYQLLSGPGRDFAMATPTCWTQFASFSEFHVGSGEATIFLHERFGGGRNGGQRRLVRVSLHSILSWVQAGGAIPLDLEESESWEPATYSSPAVMRSGGFDRSVGVPGRSIYPTRIYAGQADPSDASHFTFDYEAYGTRDTVDGWLGGDDDVRLIPRHPPTQPAASAPSTFGGGVAK